MRPGSLLERYRKCGKPNCHCAKRGARGHGPDWILTREVKGRTVTRAVPSGPAVQQTRAQIEQYQRFRALIRQLVELNQRICDIRLRAPSSAEPGDKKTALGAELHAEMAQEVASLPGRQPLQDLDFEALEIAARRAALAWVARRIQDWLNADHSDHPQAAVLCACGQTARHVGRRQKRVQSALGELHLEPAYYHCSGCGSGFCPRDQALGIEGSLSPALVRMIATVVAMVSFQEGSQLLEELAGLQVDAKQVERAAEALGAEIAAAIESAAALDTDEVPSEFTQRVLREAARPPFTQARRQAVVGDGAPWIWKIAQELFPRAIQIVDRFHLKQHLSEVAKAIYGAQSVEAKPWAQRRHEELDGGRFSDLLPAVRRHADRSEEARKCFQYLHRNREPMRYPQFEAHGLCTSSGVVEAGCKAVIGTRFKRSGMRWTVSGANAIIALRCSRLSRFQDLWERPSDRRKAA